MIEKYSGDLDTIMHYLWSDERVDQLIKKDWEQLTVMVDERSDEVSEAIHRFCSLVSREEEPVVWHFLDDLSEEIFDGLLVELARELHFLKQNQGVVLH